LALVDKPVVPFMIQVISRRVRRVVVLLLPSCWLMVMPGHAQPRTLSIKQAVELGQSQQPVLKSYQEQANAAGYAIQLARNTLVPELTAGYQAGYATYNNITGMSYPGLLLPISGPPSAGNTYSPVPGTALAAMFKWNPLTFGQRQAAVNKAAAQYKLAGSVYNEALFRQQYTVIAAYLDAVYLQQVQQSYRANITRTTAGLEQSLVLARQGLRAGIDTVQFQAALAQAETDWLTVQRQYEVQLTELSRLTGMDTRPNQLLLSDTLLFYQMPPAADTAAGLDNHPLVQHYQSKKELSEAALKEAEHAWRPKLDVWANAYARGSGVAADGTVHKADGWSLSRSNYGAGLQLSFPILQFSQINLQKKQYASLLRADEAQLDQVKLDLRKQQEAAVYNYSRNRQIAGQSAVQTKAARFAFEGLKLSYATGLVDFTRLIQGQYDLLKAETAQAGAFLHAWQSLLEMAIAHGRLDDFMQNLKQMPNP
jgi:outer membrane protein TolC